ncbi:ArsR/SmtB family transcription factor [Paenibacillus agilis]|uniref:Winged helix-turn-helix transcriptional regulator n=1 Tax=Paenibacillus agilis TaxID=3020863 RepID=A0A559J0I5_9BACL|nr:winged helix-turn-helix domain-containing protein [Paenibacillus agilis]TVX93353.1 winged helix-turn-helix transcriptional regulator [Paenibacillus agilis]
MMKTSEQEWLFLFEALANPIRLKIIASLHGKRKYVSELAREVGISRPLLYMHLQRLEKGGLVIGNLELSEDGKAVKYFELTDFNFHLTPQTIAEAVKGL